MTILRLNFLGPPRIERDGEPITLVQAKAVALLLYLAVMRSAQPRERLIDLLWPESLPQAARKNMRNTLWTVGSALGTDVLEQDGASIHLASTVEVDVHALEDGLLLLESGSVTALEAAAALYHGPLADGLVAREAPDFELWLAAERERLVEVYLRLLEWSITLHRAAKNWPAVLAQAQRALAADPLREPLHLALIEAYVRMGQRAQAAQQYATLTDILQRALDVAPLPETQARYEALLAGTPDTTLVSPSRSIRRSEPLTPLVGREAELAALDDERARAERSTARVVLISGGLGMGKSALWRRWVERRTAGAVALTTYALETSEPLPFGAVLELFRQPGPAHAITQPPSPLAPIWLAELTRLLPELALVWPNLPSPLALSPAEERARLLQALTEAMRLLAQPLLVLIVDDLHWADPSTLDWLVYLVNALRDAPLLLIGTYRPQDALERLLATVASWQRQGRLRQLPLAHLTADEATALLTALGVPGDSDQVAEWVRQSGGNPYLLIELQQAADNDTPCELAALVRARLQTIIPASAVQVLQTAAVLGANATFALIRATSGRSEEEALDALDALVEAAVLVAQDGSYRFVHPLVATVICADLTPARRAFLHRRAAEALERLHARHPGRVAGQLVAHYEAAGELRRAAYYAERAAAQALQVGAFVEAASYARRALDWEPTPQRQLLLGEALMPGGNAREAQVELEAALSGFEQLGDAVGMTRVSIMLGRIAIATSQPELARTWLSRTPVEQAQRMDPALGAQVHLLAASVERQSEAYAAAAAQLDQAAALVQTHKLLRMQAQIAFERGNLLANGGDLPAALAAFAEALRMAEESSNVVYAAMALNNLAYHRLLTEDVTSAQAHIRAAEELTEHYGLSFLWQFVHSTAGEIALAQGELDVADAALAQAFEAARAWDNRVHMANVRVNQALLARVRDDHAQARALLDEAWELFGAAVDPFVRDKIARLSAELGQPG